MHSKKHGILFHNHLINLLQEINTYLPAAEKSVAKCYAKYKKSDRTVYIEYTMGKLQPHMSHILSENEFLFSSEYHTGALKLLSGLDFKEFWYDLEVKQQKNIWRFLQNLYLTGAYYLGVGTKDKYVKELLETIKEDEQLEMELDADQEEIAVKPNSGGMPDFRQLTALINKTRTAKMWCNIWDNVDADLESEVKKFIDQNNIIVLDPSQVINWLPKILNNSEQLKLLFRKLYKVVFDSYTKLGLTQWGIAMQMWADIQDIGVLQYIPENIKSKFLEISETPFEDFSYEEVCQVFDGSIDDMVKLFKDPSALLNSGKILETLQKMPDFQNPNPSFESMLHNPEELLKANPMFANMLPNPEELLKSMTSNPAFESMLQNPEELLKSNPMFANIFQNPEELFKSMASNPAFENMLQNPDELLHKQTNPDT